MIRIVFLMIAIIAVTGCGHTPEAPATVDGKAFRAAKRGMPISVSGRILIGSKISTITLVTKSGNRFRLEGNLTDIQNDAVVTVTGTVREKLEPAAGATSITPGPKTRVRFIEVTSYNEIPTN